MAFTSLVSQSMMPSREQASTTAPRFGYPTNQAAMISMLPVFASIAALASGKGGKAVDKVGQIVGGIPGQMLAYSTEKAASDEQNNRIERAINTIQTAMGQAYIPESRHIRNVDPTLDIVARASGTRRVLAEQEAAEQADLSSRLASSGVELAPETVAELRRNISRTATDNAITKIQSMFEEAKQYYNNMKLTLAEYDTKRVALNQQNQQSLIGQALQVLTQSPVSIPSNGLFNWVNSSLTAYNDYQATKMQLASAEEQASTMATGQMVSGAASGVGSIVGGGLSGRGGGGGGGKTT